MKRGLIAYAVVVILGSWVFSLSAWALQDTLKQWAGLVMLPMAVLPFIAAFVGHRVNGHIGSPFKGLVFGGAGWIFLTWFGGLVIGYFAALACIAIGIHGLDFGMNDYIAFTVEQAAAQGNEMPAEAQGFLKIGGYVTLFLMPLITVWFVAAFTCLTTFPMYGWFARRMLAYGRPAAILSLCGIGLLGSILVGLMDNPQMADTAIWQRMLAMALLGLAFVPAALWLMLKTRSAVVPAVAQASVMMALSGVVPVISNYNAFLGVPNGLLPSVIVLLAGIALWIWQDPGGKELVVADVAFDGTPLTPEMVDAEAVADAATPPQASAGSPPAEPPATPPQD